MRILLAATAIAFLSACAPATVQGLRQEHAAHRTFEIERNYQTVYRTILDRARKCHQGNYITAQMIVQGDLYTDRGTGHVSVAMHGAAGVNTFMAMDVAAVGEGRSKVDVYAAFGTSSAGEVEEWLLDGSTDCRARRG